MGELLSKRLHARISPETESPLLMGGDGFGGVEGGALPFGPEHMMHLLFALDRPNASPSILGTGRVDGRSQAPSNRLIWIKAIARVR